MKLLKAVMTWGVKTRRIPSNPFDTFVSGQNVYGTPVYLTLDERRKVELHDFSYDPRLASSARHIHIPRVSSPPVLDAFFLVLQLGI